MSPSGFSKRERTKYQGVYRRVRSDGVEVYDIKVGNTWPLSGFPKAKLAHDERQKLIYERKFGAPLEPSRQSFAQYVEADWIPFTEARVAQGKLAGSTLRQYKSDVRAHLLPTFGETRLAQITLADVERFSARLTADGQSNHSVIRLLNTLSGVLELARRRRVIPVNPVADVEKPQARARRKPRLLTPAEVRVLAHAAPTADDRRLILVAAYTGARKGELLALRWPNVDLAAGQEAIRLVERAYEGTVEERTKTRAGNREVPLGPAAAAALREQASAGRDSDLQLVFPSPEGKLRLEQNFQKRVWNPTREKAGLADLHFHDLRHFFTTMLRAQDLPSSVTEPLLGHADARTHRGYTHQRPEDAQLIRDASSAFDGESAQDG